MLFRKQKQEPEHNPPNPPKTVLKAEELEKVGKVVGGLCGWVCCVLDCTGCAAVCGAGCCGECGC